MMINKLMWTLGIFLVLAGGVRLGTAQTGQDVVIVNTLEDVEIGCPDVCSLREAVAIVAEGGTVRFEVEFRLDESLMLTEPIVIEKSMTIQGRPAGSLTGVAFISGERATQLFVIEASVEVAMSYLSLINAYSEASGGAIENHGTLQLTDMGFYRNVSEQNGGAIFSDGTLTVFDTDFQGNRATNGGAITSSETQATSIHRSRFIGNTATEFGGAIYGDNGGFLVSNSWLSDNVARQGGAIYLFGFLDRGVIANSRIIVNRAEYGGGICNTNDDNLFFLFSSMVIGNEAATFPDSCQYTTSRGYNMIGDPVNARWVASDQLGLTMSDDLTGLSIGRGNCEGDAAVFIPAVETDLNGIARKTPCDVGPLEEELPTN